MTGKGALAEPANSDNLSCLYLHAVEASPNQPQLDRPRVILVTIASQICQSTTLQVMQTRIEIQFLGRAIRRSL